MSERDRQNLKPLEIQIEGGDTDDNTAWSAPQPIQFSPLPELDDVNQQPTAQAPISNNKLSVTDHIPPNCSWTALPRAQNNTGTPTSTPNSRDRRADSSEIDTSDIEELQLLGRGKFGRVMKCRFRRTGKYIAVKFFDDSRHINAFKVEKRQLIRVSHKNIVQLFGVSSNSAKNAFLVLEYMEDGSVYDLLKEPKVSYSSAHAISWLSQCAEAVAYLHGMKPKMLHRDLKSLNLLLRDSCRLLKVCDFGTAADMDRDRATFTNNRGTAHWMAPEVFQGRKYTEKCDVYSFGIIMWEVFTRQRPFADFKDRNAEIAICWQVSQSQMRPPAIQNFPEELETLMNSCWAQLPEDRPNINEVSDKLSALLKYFPGSDEPLARYKSQGSVVEVPMEGQKGHHEAQAPRQAKLSVPNNGQSSGSSPRRDSQHAGNFVVVETPMSSVSDIHNKLGLMDHGRRYSDAATIARRNATSCDQQLSSLSAERVLDPQPTAVPFQKGHRRGGSHETALINTKRPTVVVSGQQAIVEEQQSKPQPRPTTVQLMPANTNSPVTVNGQLPGDYTFITAQVDDLGKYDVIDERLRVLAPLLNNQRSYDAYVAQRQAADEYLNVIHQRDTLKAQKENLLSQIKISHQYHEKLAEKDRLLALIASLNDQLPTAVHTDPPN